MGKHLKATNTRRAAATSTQVQFPGRALLRTVVVLMVGQAVAWAASIGIDWSSFQPDMVDGLTEAGGLGFSVLAQWILTMPGVSTWLERFAPWLAPTSPTINEWPNDDLNDPTGGLTDPGD